MLQPVVSACYAAGSTYGTLAASKPRERDVRPMATDEFSTLLSILCQRRSGRGKAGVLRFVQSRQVFSAQAVALAPIELAPCRDPAGMEGGMHRSSGTLTDGDVLVPVLAG
jgi:hypothetical protein